MTREQRIELLALAREAKAKKKLERDADKPVAKRGRKPKEVSIEEPMEAVVEQPEPEPEPEPEDDDFDIVIQPTQKKTRAKKLSSPKEPVRSLELNNDVDVEDDVMVEEIIEVRKKPKKKIVKKIIYESDSEDEVEEVVVENKPKKAAAAKVKKVTKPVPLHAPKEPEVKAFSFFNC
jgi:hypothetical protein